MAEADGQEVLVVDGDENVQRGMHALLTEAKIVPTVIGDIDRAQALVREKYFAAAIVDLDTPRPNGAIPLITWMHREAPGTAVIVITARKVFETAVDAFRAGASDVIVKAPSEIERLKKRVVDACAHVTLSATNERLLHDVFALHEDLLKRMMETSRRAAELEERLGGGAQSSDADEATRVLIVEPSDDRWISADLAKALATKGGYSLREVSTGGEALDVGGEGRFHIALVRNQLPDLPGSMVVSSLKSQSPDTIVISFSGATGKVGRADLVEGARVITLVPELSSAAQLLGRLDELREAFVVKSRERRYLAAFRQQNYELIKRFADLKQKLKRAVEK